MSPLGGCRSRWLDGETGGDLADGPLFVHEPLADLDAALAWGRGRSAGARRGAGWVGLFSYDLGRVIEPAVEGQSLACPRAAADRAWPLIELHRVEGPGERASSPGSFRIGALRAGGADRYLANVRSALGSIRSGHIFQANLAHRMTAEFRGDPFAAFSTLAGHARARYGAFLRLAPDGERRCAVLSASPEMFFSLVPGADGTVIRARPMKGTSPVAEDPRRLRESGKERAELDMIIDLMRNDIGRISTLRSVRVEARREIERHGAGAAGLWQATATVSGRVREGVGPGAVIGAMFPAGSVTGAPKIRAMQIIDELEECRRGPYCGSIGWIGDDGSAVMNVAIRTALVSGVADGRGGIEGILDYSVGAGIVAESDPEREWEETLAKAGVLRALARPGVRVPPARRTAGLRR
jgi:isochorismate synthase EntC